ncbi:hypothetical protein MLD38_019065 [Melastoma candidum]|uniref:Uncharacterized protein n=1 Tax=Melastoma candidum TaxID=119954 RepID=A0ACB9QXP2_9MYRT|nr:hypothetical protein MLD38_019065 [Melastoma candidum]
MLSTSTPSSSSYILRPPFLPPSEPPVVLSAVVRISPPATLSLVIDSIGVPQVLTKGRARTVICGAAGGGIAEVDEGRFSEAVLRSNVPVLVEFVATWCGPCRLISPAMEWLAQEYKDRLKVVKIDHDANPKLIEEYKVYGLPTLILFKDGEEVPDSRREGAITKAKLKEYLDPLLASISVS